MIGPDDPLAWACHPRSQEALAAVVGLAKREARFRRILDDLIKSGVSDANGILQRRWVGTGWESVR